MEGRGPSYWPSALVIGADSQMPSVFINFTNSLVTYWPVLHLRVLLPSVGTEGGEPQDLVPDLRQALDNGNAKENLCGSGILCQSPNLSLP